MYTQNDIGSQCKQCSEGKIIQFRSGKIGCSNWSNHKKTVQTPSGWNELGEKLGVKTEEKDKINIANEMMSKLQTIETKVNSCHNMLNTILNILNKEMPTE